MSAARSRKPGPKPFEVSVSSKRASEAQADWLVLPLTELDPARWRLPARAAALDRELSRPRSVRCWPWVTSVASRGQTLVLYPGEGCRTERILLVGLGAESALDTDAIRETAGHAVRAAERPWGREPRDPRAGVPPREAPRRGPGTRRGSRSRHLSLRPLPQPPGGRAGPEGEVGAAALRRRRRAQRPRGGHHGCGPRRVTEPGARPVQRAAQPSAARGARQARREGREGGGPQGAHPRARRAHAARSSAPCSPWPRAAPIRRG